MTAVTEISAYEMTNMNDEYDKDESTEIYLSRPRNH